jgi:glycosyltransferase involved in cell wall biosynthesis
MQSSRCVSLVFPTMNEAKNVEALCERIYELSQDYPAFSEAIFVLNNSTDGTDTILHDLVQHEEYRFLKFMECAGARGSAIRKGVEEAKGDIIVVMDSDGQYDPLDVPELVQPIVHEGYSICIGRNSASASFFRSITSRTFKKITKVMLGVEYVQTGFKAGTKLALIETVPADVPGLDIDLRWANNIIRKGYGDKLSQAVKVHVHPRKHGRTTVNPLRLALGLFYTVISLSLEIRTGRELPFPRAFRQLTLSPRRSPIRNDLLALVLMLPFAEFMCEL